MTHHAILCLGLNINYEKGIHIATRELEKHFPTIRWATPVWTEPINFCNPNLFYNQVAELTTSLPLKEVRALCKSIEILCHRTPEAKAQGLIHMDIDILSFDEDILKPKDWALPYVQKGIQELRDSLGLSGNTTDCEF